LNNARLFSSRLTYAKGAYLVHMLRWVCGDEAFYQGITNYLNDPAIRNGSAYTTELVDHLEVTSGLDLATFMENWYRGQGYPNYVLSWAPAGGNTLTIQLDQTTSHPSVGFYAMPVPVHIKNSTQDTTVVLDHGFSGQQFTVDLAFAPDSVIFDPDLWILSGQNLVLAVPPTSFATDRPVLYPSPVAQELNIYLGKEEAGAVEVEILDATGRLHQRANRIINDQRVAVEVPSLSSGYYIARLRMADRMISLPFQKM
jgi:hypothetical protein